MLTLRSPGLFVVLFLGGLSLAGCATETLKPAFPTSSGLQRPDRMLVYDFAVTPGDTLPAGAVGSQLDPPAVQTEEEIRIGRALGKALSENLVTELRSRGISAFPASQSAAPGNSTAWIRGRFLRIAQRERSSIVGFTLGGREVRTKIEILQGSGVDLRVVGEAEYTMQTELEPGITPAAFATVVSADAKRAAQALAERVAAYYRKQGWLK
jgi:hypothetical protein